MKIRGCSMEIFRFKHDTVVRQFLSNSSEPVKFVKPSSPMPQRTVPVLPNKYIEETTGAFQANFKNCKGFVKHRYNEEYPPTHIRNCLPEKPTDIKGVDQVVYKHVQRKQILRKLPTLMSSKFFTLKFFPDLHHISLARKSNIAYTFTNRGGFNLNDPVLAKSLTEYKGKYKKLAFFQEKLCPLDTAVGRAKYRKFIKRSLFESLHKYVKSAEDLDQVRGVFFFRFTIVPATESDRQQVMTDLDLALNVLLKSNLNYKLQLLSVVKEQNKAFRNGQVLVKEVKMYNTIGARNVPGYYSKLPYIDNLKKLL
ncbi:unnamed protein product [Debaryomyces tyrocola]|nr:unnamed protein product [Debaryomyces tyrocola]